MAGTSRSTVRHLTSSTRRLPSTPASISSSSPSGIGAVAAYWQHRIGAERDRDVEPLAEPLGDAVMLGAALVPLPVHAGRPPVVHLHAVGADVAHARLGIARDHERQRDEGAAVLGPGLEHRQLVEAAVGLDDLLTGRVLDGLRHQVGEPAHERHELQRVHEPARLRRRRELLDLAREIVELLDAQRQADARHRAEEIRGDRHRGAGRPLEDAGRPAAGRLAGAVDHGGDLEIGTERVVDARQILAALELGDERVDVGETS